MGGRAKFTAMKVPRQCPLALLVKVGWRECKTFGCEKGRGERQILIYRRKKFRTKAIHKDVAHFLCLEVSFFFKS
jgi:hypothetical protein